MLKGGKTHSFAFDATTYGEALRVTEIPKANSMPLSVSLKQRALMLGGDTDSSSFPCSLETNCS